MKRCVCMLFLCALLAGCRTGDVPAPEPPPPVQEQAPAVSGMEEESLPQVVDEELPPQLEGEELVPSGDSFFLEPVAFLEESLFVMGGAALDYISTDYKTFVETYDWQKLYQQGIVDAADFLQGETRYENLIGESTLLFDNRFEGPVVSGISIGSSMDTVIQQFGEPQFTHPDISLAGYKTPGFYIAFVGEAQVEAVCLSRRYPLPEGMEDLLLEYGDGPSSVTDSWYEERGFGSTQLWRASMHRYSPTGIEIWENYNGIPITIYADYMGRIPAEALEEEEWNPDDWNGVHYRISDLDYPQHKIYNALEENRRIDADIASGEGVTFSPGGQAAFPLFSNCTYERSGYLVRYPDKSFPDTFLQFGHFPHNIQWLGDDYFCVQTMYGVTIAPLPHLDLPFVRVLDGNFDPYALVEDGVVYIWGEALTLQVGEGETEYDLSKDSALALAYAFDAQGGIQVQASVVERPFPSNA